MKAGEDRFGFIAGGTWCADHNKLVDRWPGEEDQVEILEQDIRGGGRHAISRLASSVWIPRCRLPPLAFLETTRTGAR